MKNVYGVTSALSVSKLVLVFFGAFCVFGGSMSFAVEWKEADSPKKITVRSYSGPGKKTKTKKIPWEKYLAGVVSAEINCDSPKEALMAQAVLARTFALYRVQKAKASGQRYDIRAGTRAQAVDRKGVSRDCSRSVEMTRGKVLVFGVHLVEALYHASCGGQTAAPLEVYGRPSPGLRAVACGWCSQAGSRKWSHALGRDELTGLFANAGGIPGIRGVSIARKSDRGRTLSVGLLSPSGEIQLSAVRLRRILGERLVRSTVFSIENTSTHIIFTGRGYGHGVGLCQDGMLAMARGGWRWKKILSYYYPGTSIQTLARR